jgi:hypothetical protein
MKNIIVNLKNDYCSEIFGKDLVSIEELLDKIVELDAEIERMKEKEDGDFDEYLEEQRENFEAMLYE